MGSKNKEVSVVQGPVVKWPAIGQPVVKQLMAEHSDSEVEVGQGKDKVEDKDKDMKDASGLACMPSTAASSNNISDKPIHNS